MRHYTLGFVLFISIGLKAQLFVPYLNLGYTSLSENLVGVAAFAETATALNGGSPIEVKQGRPGFNAGFGIHIPGQGETAPYARLGLNFSHSGGDAMDMEAFSLRSKSNAIDLVLGGGLMTEAGAAFYILAGPSFISNKWEVTGTTDLNGAYTSSFMKFSYGLGLGFYGEGGGGLALDLLCNFNGKPENKFPENQDGFTLPANYSNYQADPANYNGDAVNAGYNYIRAQITFFLGLGGN